MITAWLHQNADWPARWLVVVDHEPPNGRVHFFATSEQDALVYASSLLGSRYPKDTSIEIEVVS